MDGVAVPITVFTDEQLNRLKTRVYPPQEKGAPCDVWFLWKAKPHWLPVDLEGRTRVMRWGAEETPEAKLPRVGFARRITLEKGGWSGFRPVEGVIPCTRALANGVWFPTPGGLKALICMGADSIPVAYPLVEPARFYFRVLTRAELMPVFAKEGPDWKRLVWEPEKDKGGAA